MPSTSYIVLTLVTIAAVVMTALNTYLLYSVNVHTKSKRERPVILEPLEVNPILPTEVNKKVKLDVPVVDGLSNLKNIEQRKEKVSEDTIGVLVVACNRPLYLKRSLHSIFKYLPTDEIITDGVPVLRYNVVVSQDGKNDEVWRIASHDYGTKLQAMQHAPPQYEIATGVILIF